MLRARCGGGGIHPEELAAPFVEACQELEAALSTASTERGLADAALRGANTSLSATLATYDEKRRAVEARVVELQAGVDKLIHDLDALPADWARPQLTDPVERANAIHGAARPSDGGPAGQREGGRRPRRARPAPSLGDHGQRRGAEDPSEITSLVSSVHTHVVAAAGVRAGCSPRTPAPDLPADLPDLEPVGAEVGMPTDPLDASLDDITRAVSSTQALVGALEANRRCA